MITQTEYEKVQKGLKSITTRKELVVEIQNRMSKDNLSKRVINDFINHFIDIVTSGFRPIETNIDKVVVSGLGTFTTKKIARMEKGKGILKNRKEDIPERRKPVVRITSSIK